MSEVQTHDFFELDIGQYLEYLRTSGKKPFPFILISGRRGLGKSFCGRDVVFHFRHYDKVICFSGSEGANGDWRGVCSACDAGMGISGDHTCRIPPGCIHTSFKPATLQKCVDSQERECLQNGDAAKPLLIILDDLAWDSDTLNKDKTLKKIAMMGRHWKITCIIITQYILDLQPKIRRQATMFFSMGETDDAVVKKLKEEFFSILGSVKTVQRIMNVLTDDYGTVVKVDTSSKNVKEMIYRYKAKDRGQYQVGSKAFRDYIFSKTMTQQEILAKKGSVKPAQAASKNTIRIRVHDKNGRVTRVVEN